MARDVSPKCAFGTMLEMISLVSWPGQFISRSFKFKKLKKKKRVSHYYRSQKVAGTFQTLLGGDELYHYHAKVLLLIYVENIPLNGSEITVKIMA